MKRLRIVGTWLLAGALVLACAVAGLGMLLPASVRVERKLEVAAPPGALYPYLANLRDGWPKWSPFGRAQDPQMAVTYSGPAQGAGATERWTSPNQGSGRMTITRAESPVSVEYEVEAVDGRFRMTGALHLAATLGGGTEVTWIDQVELGGNPLMRWVGLLLPGALGSSFDKGLAALSRLVPPTQPPPPHASDAGSDAGGEAASETSSEVVADAGAEAGMDGSSDAGLDGDADAGYGLDRSPP